MFNNKGGISFIFILVGIISVLYFYNICRIIFDLYRIKKNGFKRNGESEGIIYI